MKSAECESLHQEIEEKIRRINRYRRLGIFFTVFAVLSLLIIPNITEVRQLKLNGPIDVAIVLVLFLVSSYFADKIEELEPSFSELSLYYLINTRYFISEKRHSRDKIERQLWRLVKDLDYQMKHLSKVDTIGIKEQVRKLGILLNTLRLHILPYLDSKEIAEIDKHILDLAIACYESDLDEAVRAGEEIQKRIKYIRHAEPPLASYFETFHAKLNELYTNDIYFNFAVHAFVIFVLLLIFNSVAEINFKVYEMITLVFVGSGSLTNIFFKKMFFLQQHTDVVSAKTGGRSAGRAH